MPYRNLKGCDYMRIYISGAITKDKNYFNHFERVENELKKLGFSCINPAKVNSNMPDDFTHEDYMKMSLCLLSLCDAAYFLNGWSNSNGANKEYRYALEHSIKAIFEEQKVPTIYRHCQHTFEVL